MASELSSGGLGKRARVTIGSWVPRGEGSRCPRPRAQPSHPIQALCLHIALPSSLQKARPLLESDWIDHRPGLLNRTEHSHPLCARISVSPSVQVVVNHPIPSSHADHHNSARANGVPAQDRVLPALTLVRPSPGTPHLGLSHGKHKPHSLGPAVEPCAHPQDPASLPKVHRILCSRTQCGARASPRTAARGWRAASDQL